MFKSLFKQKESVVSKKEQADFSKEDLKFQNQQMDMEERPKGHGNYGEEDKEKCPYFSIQQKKEQLFGVDEQEKTVGEENKNEGEQGEENQKKKEKKEKKPKGGCPFMPSEKKKNPGLGSLVENYNLEYISNFNYLLDYKGMDAFKNFDFQSLDAKKNLNKEKGGWPRLKREVFDQYPIYLKHTLFQDEENMQKARKCELSQRFFVYDQFREKGNKFYQKEMFQEAIYCYERALGVVKWLELIDEEEIEVQKKMTEKKLNEKVKYAHSLEGFNFIQQKIQENQQKQSTEYERLLRNKKVFFDQENQHKDINNLKSNTEQSQEIEQNLNLTTDQKENQNENYNSDDNNNDYNENDENDNNNDDNLSQHTIRSDEAIDDEEDYMERENQHLKEDVEQEIRDKELEELMEHDNFDDSETTVILDKEKDQEEKAKKRKVAEEIQKMRDEDREMKKKYKTLLTTYSDENVKLCDGEQLKEQQDIDMRRSMLMAIYLNLSVAYMRLFYFKLARQALEDALKISDKSSLVFYRKSQSLAFDKFSNLLDLQQAKEDIERAMYLKNYEKIFNGEQGALKIMNLLNHKEAYIEQAHYVMNRIEGLKQLHHQRITELLEREREIEEIYQQMKTEGQIPIDDDEGHEMALLELREEEQTNMEIQVVRIMIQKYYDLIDFYQETAKPEKVQRAKNELLKLKEVYNDIMFYQQLDFQNKNDEILNSANKQFEIDFNNTRTQKRLLRMKREKIREVYESQQFNFDMFEYALKEYFKRKENKEKKKQEMLKVQATNPKKNDPKNTFISTLFSLETSTHIIFAAIIILIIVYYNNNSNNPFNLYSFISKKK